MLKRMYRSISMRLLFVIMILILPFNIVTIMLSNASVNATLEQSRLSIEKIMENQVTELNNKIANTEVCIYQLCFNEQEGKNFFRQSEETGFETIKIMLLDRMDGMNLQSGADGYFAYNATMDTWLITGKSDQNKSDVKSFFQQRIENGIESGWHLDEIEECKVLYYLMDFKMRENRSGGWINLEEIYNNLKKGIQHKSAVFSVTEEKIESEGEGSVVVSASCSKGFFLNVVIDKSEILGDVEDLNHLLRKYALASLLILPILYVIIYYMLLSPIQVILRAQKQIREGNLDYRINEKARCDEFENVYESFNRMAGQIQFLKIDNYEKQISYQKMELDNLQLQIRPHFLLNTFNLIYTLAEWRENDAVQNIILYLSDYFRYLFRKKNELELFGREKDLIDKYMQMIAVRYPGCVDIAYICEKQIEFVRVPPFLLHNFVENIIKHVVRQGSLTHIKIVGTYANKEVLFRIVDDGQGISKEKLQEIKECMHQKETDGSHVGYYNSLRRLKYFYGETAEIQIDSELGEGTQVTIRFPYDLEVTGDEFIDCK